MEEAIRALRKKVSEGMMNSLRLRTLPVGVKLLRDPKELDPACEILDEPLTFCQFVTYARVYGRSLGVTQENLVCAIAKGMLGFVDLPAGMAKRFATVRTSTAEAFEKILKTGLRIEPGRFQAALVAPLGADFRRSGCCPYICRWRPDDPTHLRRYLSDRGKVKH